MVLIVLLFSCNGNGQTTNSVTENDPSKPKERVEFNGDYNGLLTLEMAARITGFDASRAKKSHTMKGMLAETLRYYWENDRKKVIEGSTFPRVDRVQLNWVDGDADLDSFVDFVDLKKHLDLIKINGVGELAYWNPNKNYLDVYHRGISFRIEVDSSNDGRLEREKTIELATQIIREKINKS